MPPCVSCALYVCACLLADAVSLTWGHAGATPLGVDLPSLAQNHLSEMLGHTVSGVNRSSAALPPATARAHVYSALHRCADCPLVMGQYDSYAAHAKADSSNEQGSARAPTAACVGFEYTAGVVPVWSHA